MSLSFILIAIIFFCIGIYMLILGKYAIMSSMLIIAFISYLIGNLKQVRKIVKKINIKGLEIEFKNQQQKKFIDIAIELLENNFPILSDVGQEEVNKRVAAWIKDFVSEIEKQKIPVANTRLFYDPNFQYVLNKAIETVARRNNKIINGLMILCLIKRLENSEKQDNVSNCQIDTLIVYELPKYCEEHFKLLSSILLYENLSKTVPCDNLECFKTVVIPLILHFHLEDVTCYFDIQRSILVHNFGNANIMGKKGGNFYTDYNFYEHSKPLSSFWNYLTFEYPFLQNLSEEQKRNLLNNENLTNLAIRFHRIYKNTMLTPLCYTIISDFYNDQLELFDAKNKIINIEE